MHYPNSERWDIIFKIIESQTYLKKHRTNKKVVETSPRINPKFNLIKIKINPCNTEWKIVVIATSIWTIKATLTQYIIGQ